MAYLMKYAAHNNTAVERTILYEFWKTGFNAEARWHNASFYWANIIRKKYYLCS